MVPLSSFTPCVVDLTVILQVQGGLSKHMAKLAFLDHSTKSIYTEPIQCARAKSYPPFSLPGPEAPELSGPLLLQ